ncbi:hypothetical protein P5673_031224, partial [Acropora cervicornis]
MSGLNPSDHDLLQPATKRPSCTPVIEIQEIYCKNSMQEMPKMAKVIEAFHDNILSVVLNMYVLAVINYGISHLSERSIDESQTIPIKLKRRLSYKHYYQFQNVRPRRVLKAAKYFVETSELFQNEHILKKFTKIGSIILILEERTSGVTDTLLQEPDMTENVEKITFAPGEGNKPL